MLHDRFSDLLGPDRGHGVDGTYAAARRLRVGAARNRLGDFVTAAELDTELSAAVRHALNIALDSLADEQPVDRYAEPLHVHREQPGMPVPGRYRCSVEDLLDHRDAWEDGWHGVCRLIASQPVDYGDIDTGNAYDVHTDNPELVALQAAYVLVEHPDWVLN